MTFVELLERILLAFQRTLDHAGKATTRQTENEL